MSPEELARLEREYQSGRNPLAYIPYCQALRKGHQYARALNICARENRAGGSGSIAGRTLYCRLLADTGRYAESLEEAESALRTAPGSMRLQVEKARALIKLHRPVEARAVIDELNGANPLDPEVQLLNTMMRSAVASSQQQRGRSGEVAKRAAILNSREIVEQLARHIAPVSPVAGVAVIPIDAGEPFVTGPVEFAEAALLFCQEVAVASAELDTGGLLGGVLETERKQLFVASRRRLIIALAVDPSPAFGKVFHRFQLFLKQMFPDPDETGRMSSTERIPLE
ncbi:MAG: tetratricopeptide repeat protein [Candidatus Sumerlaeia bacterium]|nr:tetratricopeptide repeat protein [Candidatus Sumerlaeia bacterium]